MCNNKSIIIIDEDDNVATAIKKIKKGQEIIKGFIAKCNINPGFKIAIKNIKKGEKIIKYGEVIGKTNKPIEKGELVHVHNVDGLRGRGDNLKESDLN